MAVAKEMSNDVAESEPKSPSLRPKLINGFNKIVLLGVELGSLTKTIE